ncbi:hypothetical protein Lal_00035193 [Lupinus albus]|nr:hypothetical protein Lal_00035193 [Lupinus albus]
MVLTSTALGQTRSSLFQSFVYVCDWRVATIDGNGWRPGAMVEVSHNLDGEIQMLKGGTVVAARW